MECSRISYDELQKIFQGKNVDIRTMPIQGDVTKAIEFFYNNINGKPYDLFSTNCTWAIWELSKAYEVEKPLVNWVNVQKALTNPIVQEFLKSERLHIPETVKYILFPDEFIKIGTVYADGIVL